MQKIKILYYNTTLKKGGTDIFMMGIVKNLNKEKFSIDVLIKDGDSVDNNLLSAITNDGHNVYLAHGSFIKRVFFLKKFFKTHKNEYDCIHINATSQSVGIISYFAHHYGKIKKIIFHSHMGGNDHPKRITDRIGFIMLKKYSTIFATCSTVASEFMFGKKFCTNHSIIKLNNSVDTDIFQYNQMIRESTRQELNLAKHDFAILHVGRFVPAKNHKKLIEIFNEIIKKEKDAKLILIGNGPLLEDVKQQVKNLKLSEKVLFLGEQNNIAQYMQACDCFVMPSLHEGLPIVAVEAQSTGLPLVLSSNISVETKLTDNTIFIDLDADLLLWVDNILKFKNIQRHSQKEILINKGFNKATLIKNIEQLYME